ncbi:hypothetical protein OQJ05_03190 [Fluoribacter gormanii]|uniref:hypothetical protein n=1 Tax=Fluoribacter gormanii TaxID=464 RepID=UPI002242ED42|nr:hypothetical protein [Fluoribacter gormanii]MCW8443056.1 hypothetical protein [Fluoribacter gormanii]
MNSFIKSLLLFSSLCFTIFAPTTLFADDCDVDCAKGSNQIDCPGKGCGCWCDKDQNAKCKCTQPLDEHNTNTNTNTNTK